MQAKELLNVLLVIIIILTVAGFSVTTMVLNNAKYEAEKACVGPLSEVTIEYVPFTIFAVIGFQVLFMLFLLYKLIAGRSADDVIKITSEIFAKKRPIGNNILGGIIILLLVLLIVVNFVTLGMINTKWENHVIDANGNFCLPVDDQTQFDYLYYSVGINWFVFLCGAVYMAYSVCNCRESQ